jgi:hypothetical protein
MASQATQRACTCTCGSTDLEETAIKLEMEVQSITGSWPRPVDLFMRTCRQCGQVTFWSESSRTHKTAEPLDANNLLDPL